MSHFNIFRRNKYHFISEEEYQNKMDLQHSFNSNVLKLFKKYGGGKGDHPVEFFFYTDEEDKATNLAIELNRLGYEVYDIDQSTTDDQWSILGRTGPLKMTTRSMTKWSKQMVELGYKYDCEFDGWGTLIE